jgi:HSP20 family protein
MVRTGQLFPFSQLRQEMDRAMNSVLTGAPGAWLPDFAQARVFPALNVWEQADELCVEAELPGLKADELDISVEGDVLTIKGQRGENAQEGATFHRRERGVGAFSRVLRLPVPVAPDRVQASFRDGVLLITLPKAEEARPRKIKVAGQA